MIQPDDFLALVDVLAQGGTEAEWRTAVSRAYYAAFLATRELFRDLGFQVPRAAQAHAYLWMRLSNSGNLEVARAGADLNDLQRERNRSDYDNHVTIHQSDAVLLVQVARQLTQRLGSARVDPLRTQIRDAMRDYERNVLGAVTWQGP
jgi:uncharacterized protein (UPF0332 family)